MMTLSDLIEDSTYFKNWLSNRTDGEIVVGIPHDANFNPIANFIRNEYAPNGRVSCNVFSIFANGETIEAPLWVKNFNYEVNRSMDLQITRDRALEILQYCENFLDKS